MRVAPDEARARQTLLAMHERISRDPYDALGLTGSPDPAQVRAAFLAATKQFHPAKFARMSHDVQKLANEVFLALRAAHDTLARSAVTTRTSGSIPAVASVRATGPVPTLRAASSQSMRPLASTPTRARTPTGNPAASAAAPPLPPSRAASPPRTAAASSSRLPVVGRIAVGRPAGAGPRSPGTVATSSARRSGAHPAVAPAAAGPAGPPSSGDHDVAPILALLAQNQFAAARAALEVLAASAPHTTRYRALIAYANGREAQLARRLDEARVELMDALQLDPDLQLAKVALAELFTRRK